MGLRGFPSPDPGNTYLGRDVSLESCQREEGVKAVEAVREGGRGSSQARSNVPGKTTHVIKKTLRDLSEEEEWCIVST